MENKNNTPKKQSMNDLMNVLTEYKDAVIVLGGRMSLKDIPDYSVYNRKTMIKEPSKFWTYYKDLFKELTSPSDIDIYTKDLIDKGCIKLLINTKGSKGFTNVKNIPLKGDVTELICNSCYAKYRLKDEEALNSFLKNAIDNNEPLKCECGGKIAPTILMENELYRGCYTEDVKDSLFEETDNGVHLKSHALILIDVDTEETYITELIDSFNSIKAKENLEIEDFANKYYLVMICERDGINIEEFKPEFVTYENVADSLKRLNATLEEYKAKKE